MATRERQSLSTRDERSRVNDNQEYRDIKWQRTQQQRGKDAARGSEAEHETQSNTARDTARVRDKEIKTQSGGESESHRVIGFMCTLVCAS